MSTRAMIFIDGSWLAVTANRLADQHGLQGRTGGPLDFGALPRVCAQAIAAQMASATGLDVVRTHYFGSIATNFDTVDQDAVQRRSEFFDSLRRHHRYEVYRYETDYRGHRVRRTPGEEGFVPQETMIPILSVRFFNKEHHGSPHECSKCHSTTDFKFVYNFHRNVQ